MYGTLGKARIKHRPVVPQNVVRREMMAKLTQPTELGPLRALPTVRRARNERGMHLSLAQCAQLTLTSDFVWEPPSSVVHT